MKLEQKQWTETTGWREIGDASVDVKEVDLVLCFAAKSVLEARDLYSEMREMYPAGNILICSTSGEIVADTVEDNSVAVTAIQFASSTVAIENMAIESTDQSFDVGKKIGAKLSQQGLVHAMVFSDGLLVNGTDLVKGLRESLPEQVAVTGGMVGDAVAFKETLLGINEKPASGNVVLIGFYGNSLRVGYGSFGGWDPFGPDRDVTKASGNTLFELDGMPALELYKRYLGDRAKDLPASGLLFPLSLRVEENGREVEVVRTLLAVDEKAQSMTFAGDIPMGVRTRFMKANFDRIIDGAATAADMSISTLESKPADLAVLVSCVGRKLVLGARVEEEVEAVHAQIGKQVATVGFYSYGEISPIAATERQCMLHNQTMTITTFREE